MKATISAEDYIKRVEFLYGATRRYFKLAKELFGEKKWIPRLCEHLNNRTISCCGYRSTYYDGASHIYFSKGSKTTVIGLYFPPENYPAVDGIYPSISICVSGLKIANVQLDGTHQIHKPMGEIYWYPGFLMHAFALNVRSYGKPFYTLEFVDSVNVDWESAVFWFLSPSRRANPSANLMTAKLARLCGYNFGATVSTNDNQNDFFNGETSKLQGKLTIPEKDNGVRMHYRLTYPYKRAAEVIVRFLRRHIEKKRQRIRNEIGFVIRALPGGVDFEQRASNYRHWG